MCPHQDKLEKSQRISPEPKPISQKELQSKIEALKEYQKLGPENDQSIDIIHKP